MEVKNISRERLEQIAQKLINRVADFEGRYNGGFVSALAWDGISMDEAKALESCFNFDSFDVARHAIFSGFTKAGTYHIFFYDDDLDCATEFYAYNEEELEELWDDFCDENHLKIDCITDVQFVCEEEI